MLKRKVTFVPLYKNLVCLQVYVSVCFLCPERGRLKGDMNTICETTKETDGVSIGLFNLNPSVLELQGTL